MTAPNSPTPLVSNRSSLPKHLQLKQFLMTELKTGRLYPGAALPTEVELAELRGVARNTVRQALAELEQEGIIERLRGKGTFVRNHIEAAAPPKANSLRVYGLLVPFTNVGYYPSLQRGFMAAAERRYRQVIVCGTEDEIAKQAESVLQLLDKEVAGVAIVPTDHIPTPPHHLRPFQKNGVPLVFCHRRVPEVRAPLVTFSALDVGRTAGEALASRGHRKVAFATTWPSEMGKAYLAGLRETLEAAGGGVPESWAISLPEPFNLTHAQWEKTVAAQLAELFSGPQRPTAIFASFDTIAERLYLLLGQMGYRVPEDVSLIGFGDALRQGAVIEKITSVTVDEMQLGVRAGELIDEMCEGVRELHDEEKIVLPVGLSEGISLGTVS